MTNERPNILFIMADDHAAKAIGCYGHGINQTPHLDRIAQQGMRFNHCYVTNSICTPSRATILTGTHNHVNGVFTLASKINNRLPNVAKQLRVYGYQTAMIGKWHLGEGKEHEPTGFDHWEVIPGQGRYSDPEFISPEGQYVEKGYATDVITEKTMSFIEKRDKSKPFFVMCHHKAPHRSWEYDKKYQDRYREDIKVPDTFTDDYKNRARAAMEAKMRVESDLTYFDLGLLLPDGSAGSTDPRENDSHKIPLPDDVSGVRLVDKDTKEVFTFKTKEELSQFKYQRYMKRYLRTIQSIDDNVGRLLDYLDQQHLTENTMVIYTSDQGFFLGDHGWFDKRFIYEESFQMPFLIQGPGIKPGTVCNSLVSNVDFAPTWLEFAKVPTPTYMQGESFLSLIHGDRDRREDPVSYHRYWMHGDPIHNAYAHYGIRSKRYKLIYWYNQGFGLPQTREGGEEKEWELFDCEKDPMELFNCWSERGYEDIREGMVRRLEKKMMEIGDEPDHPFGLPAEDLARLAAENLNIASKANQHNI